MVYLESLYTRHMSNFIAVRCSDYCQERVDKTLCIFAECRRVWNKDGHSLPSYATTCIGCKFCSDAGEWQQRRRAEWLPSRQLVVVVVWHRQSAPATGGNVLRLLTMLVSGLVQKLFPLQLTLCCLRPLSPSREIDGSSRSRQTTGSFVAPVNLTDKVQATGRYGVLLAVSVHFIEVELSRTHIGFVTSYSNFDKFLRFNYCFIHVFMTM